MWTPPHPTPASAISTCVPSSPWTSGSLPSTALDQSRKAPSPHPGFCLSIPGVSVCGMRREKPSSSCSQVPGSTDTHRLRSSVAETWGRTFQEVAELPIQRQVYGVRRYPAHHPSFLSLGGTIFIPVIQATTMEHLYKWKPLLPPDQCCLSELRQWWKYSLPVFSNTVAISHMWLLSTWKVASMTEELNFHFI